MRREVLLLIILFLASFVIRWYRLPEHLYFGFEQGRDAVIIRDISRLKDFQLVGPKTDIGGLFHGAWYYYLMVIPFLLSKGNPLGLAAFQVLLSSATVLLIYAGVRSVTSSKSLGLIAAIIGMFSYESILYARWISNVSPAMLFIPLGMFMVWKYKTTKRTVNWCIALFCFVFAIQFEIALLLSVPFVLLLLFLAKLLPFPNRQQIFAAGAITVLLFGPMMFFNIRNQNIIGNTVVAYIKGNADQKREFNLPTSLRNYVNQHKVMVIRNLFNETRGDSLRFVISISILTIGLLLDSKKKTHRSQIAFFLCWVIATLPVILFTENVNASQIYVGWGVGYIGLATLAIRGYWSHTEYRIFLLPLVLSMLMGVTSTITKLHKNQDVFYRTIQDDLNYKDQRAALAWVHKDANGQPYRFDAYTIPYYQPHAWNYLRSLWYPEDSGVNPSIMYLVIELRVDPHWEKTWISEIGQTSHIEERTFGEIRVKKLQLL